jgi:RimJ/RimL family protein N-acetyltransferase
MTELRTTRLLLRPLVQADAPHLSRLFEGDREAIERTGRMPYPPTESAIRIWLKGHTGSGSHSFLIVRKADSEATGAAGFGGTHEVAELGYSFGRAYWGRGYATEVVGALVEHARSLGLGWLEAYSFLENPASARVLEKAGFDVQGVVERDYPLRGGMRPVRYYRLRLREGV